MVVETDGRVDGGGLWGVGNGIEMVVFATIQVCKQGRGSWCKSSKLSGNGSTSGLAGNSSRKWWWGVMGQLICCDSSGGTSCSQTPGRERVGQPLETQNQAVMLGLRSAISNGGGVRQ